MNVRRLSYLQALGVEAWVRRIDGILPPPATEDVTPAAGSPVPVVPEAAEARNAPPPAQIVDPQGRPPAPMTQAGRPGAPESDLDAFASATREGGAGPPRGPEARARVIDPLDTRLDEASRDETNRDPASDDGGIAQMGWSDLERAVRHCTRCALHATRTQGVFGVGNRQAHWMIVGEAPGADEDRQGEPFVGRAGQLLNTMLEAVGLSRETVFIANILKSRPPGNRDPKPEETRACLPYLYRQIELIDPVIILCVGRVAAQTLLRSAEPIGRLRGKLHHVGRRPMVVTYHPAYLLRSPGEKRKSWADLVLAMQTYERSERSERSGDYAGHGS